MTREELYGIHSNHTLKEITSRQRGTMAQNESWVHEEMDESGNLVARYESWHNTPLNLSQSTDSGYRKYDAQGMLVETHDSLDV